MHHKLVEYCILRPGYMLRREPVFSLLKRYKALENCSYSHIKNNKNENLKKLLLFAKKKIPFYKNINLPKFFENSTTNDNLINFPIIKKEFLNKYINFFISPGFKLRWKYTSGSTGEPFFFPKDSHGSSHMDAVMLSFYLWHGVKPGDRQARVWGSAINAKDVIFQKLKDVLLNRKRLSAFSINKKTCIEYYHCLDRFRPNHIYCYPNALYQFAKILQKFGFNGKQINIPIAICTGEILYDYQRKFISEFFGCKVVNEYGSTENGIIAFECEYGNLHVSPSIHLEIIDADENGFGSILVTELNSRTIPFIRYDIGDIGRLLYSPCSCGRSYEILELKEGRFNDIIYCVNGKIVYASVLSYSMKDFALKFKAIQTHLNKIIIEIVPRESFNSIKQNKLIKNLQVLLGNEMNICFKIRDDIEFEKSGKLKYFFSEISNFRI